MGPLLPPRRHGDEEVPGAQVVHRSAEADIIFLLIATVWLLFAGLMVLYLMR